MRTSVRNVVAVALAVSWLGVAGQVSAALILSTGSPQYMGHYTPPEPASISDELGYINTLKGLAPGASTTVPFSPPFGSTRDFVRSSNTLCYATCPDALLAGAEKDDSPSNVIDLGTGGWAYLLGKYDGPNGGSRVWYVAGLTGEVEIPTDSFGANDSQYGLSHWTRFNPGPNGNGNGNGNGGGPGNGNGNGGGPGNGNGVPEPATLGLIGLGMLALGALRRRKLSAADS